MIFQDRDDNRATVHVQCCIMIMVQSMLTSCIYILYSIHKEGQVLITPKTVIIIVSWCSVKSHELKPILISREVGRVFFLDGCLILLLFFFLYIYFVNLAPNVISCM